MNDLTRSLERTDPSASLPADDFDALLGRFFRAEMPDPWPGLPILPLQQPTARAMPRRWFRHGRRLALVASISLFFLGYLALASFFPRHSAGMPDIKPVIGKHPGLGVPQQPKKPGEGKIQLPRLERLPLERVPLNNPRPGDLVGFGLQGVAPATVPTRKQG